VKNSIAQATLDAIDARVAERGLLQHPFYQRWTKGELTIPILQDYAKQYYRHVAAFPTYVSAVHSHTEDQATRRRLLANLMDEEAGNPNHPELWMQFAEGLGVEREDVEATEPRPDTSNLVETLRSICRDGSTAEGLAALYAYESQIPAVSESKIDGLQRFYGIADDDTLAYFRVHIEADREHSAVERKLLEEHITEENKAAVLESVDKTLEVLWEMLSGISRQHQLAC
jgi:pyrroloquinoline-quinone synthase